MKKTSFSDGKPLCKHACLWPVLWAALAILISGSVGMSAVPGADDPNAGPVELSGDQIEYSMQGNKVVAQGHVVISRADIRIFCDRLEFFRDSQMVIAEGNVELVRKNERFQGSRMKYNFQTMKGEFLDMKIYAKPFYGAGKKLSKVGENHLRIERGYITTCDFDKPTFRLVSKKVDIYLGDKAVSRNVRFLIGEVPIFYIPRLTQSLKDQKPSFIMTPGYKKDWGMFLLTQWRYILNDNVKGVVHLDFRERKDVAWGFDAEYKTNRFGNGKIRTYYMNERSITSKRFWQERLTPTPERERFKAEWRHKWEIDSQTMAIWQYYKLSDQALLKDYFENEYERDSNPASYFLLTRTLPAGTLSFRTDVRVNRYESLVERLPEITYDFANQKLGPANVYLRSKTSYSNLTKKTARPSEDRRETMRLNTENELSYPKKVGFIEVRPYVGGQNTYYSKTLDREKYNSVRGIFWTGADFSTKFYRIYDFQRKVMGVDIHRLRHIITPTVAYRYQHEPTIPNSAIDQFDSVDTLTRDHKMRFGMEHKLQTKRGGQSIDLLRATLFSDFLLKESPGKGGFNNVVLDVEITPNAWVQFYSDVTYDTISERLQTANFDVYINDPGARWYLRIGKRYHVEVDDQLTGEFEYKFNQKWQFRTYQRFDLNTGIFKESQFGVRRDLHAWIMDINFNTKRGEGDEIWVVFTLKAFPEIGFDVGTSFNRRKLGSQPL